jgi:hypothetical protein
MRPRRQHVGEHAARTQKHIVCDRDTGVHGHVVLDLYAVAHLDTRTDEHVLTKHTSLSDGRAATNVGEVPNPRPASNTRPVVDDSRLVNERIAH